MPTAAIITNRKKDPDGLYTKKVADILKRKYTVLFDSDYSEDNIYKMFKESDVAVVLGGDGTLLSASDMASSFDVPLLGINLGHLGFMADVEEKNIEESLNTFLDGGYKIDRRFMIDAFIEKKDGSRLTISALNDIVVTRASYQRMVAFDIKVNGDNLATYQGDGLVVATPTGSTAYSMSAGGPVVDPSLEVCIITPVCPHTMSSKPVIVPGQAEIQIDFKSTFDDKAMLTADGKEGIGLCEGDVIKIKGSERKLGLIRLLNRSFYDILNLKLQG
ncbi:MAG: NAD(+)/NADH kinase [Clostridia bacterium]|nr:NAD(+)/NADH kinase [Clostridia bacterium]